MKPAKSISSVLENHHADDESVSKLALLFDRDFYLAENADVKKSKLDPFRHFLEHGAKERRSPHPLFDSSYYFDRAPYPEAIGDNPLIHFLHIGHRLGFNPHPLFDLDYYRQQAGELDDENPLLHFLAHGKELQLSPHPLFDTKFYLKNNADARKSKLNPLLHFLRYGRAKQPHPLFDARFYLSEYADVRKSSINPLVHFVWRGARERRWPNANFDTLRYLKMILPASFDNPLIHYVETGQKQGLLADSSRRDHLHKKYLLQKVLSFVSFFFLCLLHVQHYKNISKTKNRAQKLSTFKFLRMAAYRFWHHCGSQVEFTRPTYLMQQLRMAKAQPYPKTLRKSPLTAAYLYLANVFKVQGFFEDAEIILRDLSKGSHSDIALCSLADLLLTQAIWSNEFTHYQKAGIALKDENCSWQKRTFAEALATLEQSAIIASDKVEAQWLLCYGYLTAGKYSQALEAINKFPDKPEEAAEKNLLKARAVFGLNPEEGITVRSQYLGKWSANCNIAALRQVSAADLPEETVQNNTCLVQPIAMQIESKVVRGGEVRSLKNTLEFSAGYLTQFKSAQIIPENGIIVVSNQMLVKELNHIKPCHLPVFSSYIQAVKEDTAFLCAPKTTLFKEENCIYIGSNNNFYHWLLDELPRLSLIDQTSSYNNLPILIDRRAAAWQYTLLSMLGIEQDRLLAINLEQPTSFKNLIVPSRLSRDMVAHPHAVAYLREKLLDNYDIAKPTPNKRIYITRGIAAKTDRALLNEQIVIDKFKRNNFKIVDTGALSIQRQIELFRDADVIAGTGGAGLANMLFAPKGARLLSLSAGDVLCETFTSIAAVIKQESWWITGPSYARPHPHWIWTSFDYEIAEKDIDYCFEWIL